MNKGRESGFCQNFSPSLPHCSRKCRPCKNDCVVTAGTGLQIFVLLLHSLSSHCMGCKSFRCLLISGGEERKKNDHRLSGRKRSEKERLHLRAEGVRNVFPRTASACCCCRCCCCQIGTAGYKEQEVTLLLIAVKSDGREVRAKAAACREQGEREKEISHAA